MRKVSSQLNRILSSAAAYKIVAFLILLALMLGAYNANRSYAWFTDQENVPFSLESGKVHYEVSYTAATGYMVPGKNLFEGFTLTNKSSIDTDVRLRIEYTVWEEGATPGATAVSSTAIYITNGALSLPNDDQYLNMNIDDSRFTLQNMGGTTAMSGSWWAHEPAIPAVTSGAIEVGEIIPVFKEPITFCYDGPKTGNVYEKQPITITIHLQAKQADHIEWKDLTMVEEFTGN